MDVDARRTRFDAVARTLIEPLRRYLVRRTDPATADDVLSETLLVCWRRLDEMPAEPLAWAYAVARNCLANADRSRRRQDRLVARIWRLDRPPAQTTADPRPDLTAALARLPDLDAELIRLWAWEELGPAEIAEVTGLTPNAVSIRLHRARQKLKPLLRKQDDHAGHEEATEGRRP